jgi:hypothetical protein
MLLNWDASAPIKIFIDKYYEEKCLCWRIFLAKIVQLLRNSSFLRSQSDFSLKSSNPEPNFQRATEWKWLWGLGTRMKYLTLEQTWSRSAGGRTLDWYPKVVGSNFSACSVWIYTQNNIKNIIFTWVHNIKTHPKNIMIIEHIGIEGTRLSSEIPHTRTDLAS